MALKRINKELTDLGRYVLPSLAATLPALFARMTARSAGRRQTRCTSAAARRCCFKCSELTLTVVILPRPALPVPSEMIWYVTPPDPTAEAAKPPSLSSAAQHAAHDPKQHDD